jgi:hypothetical protein
MRLSSLGARDIYAVIVGMRWGNGGETRGVLLKHEPMLVLDSLGE